MLAIRHRNDSVSLLPIAGLLVEREQDAQFIASLQGRDPAEMENRFANGHRAYVAWLDGQPAAWGWVATARAEIGELTTAFEIPRQQRYLWNFVTLPAYRGRGIYPRLLDAIVRNELADAEIFWVAYAPENAASAAGIHKAGFATVATLSFDSEGHPAVTGQTQAHAAAASQLLGIAASDSTLAQCWRCVRAGRGPMSCRAGACACDYQQPQLACH